MNNKRMVIVDDKGVVLEAYTGDGPIYIPAYVEGSTSMQTYDWD